MKLAVLTYEFVDYAPEGIPINWPAEVMELQDEEQLPGENWIEMTISEFQDHKSQYQEDYNTWENVYLAPTIQQTTQTKIQAAIDFGLQTLKDFATENVLLGITQAEKTVQVTNYLHKLEHYIRSGSLYAAIEEIDRLISEGLDETLEPFITEARLNTYKSQIQEYLGI